MDVLHNIHLGFSIVFDPINFAYCFLGCFVGTLIGVLPGVGPLAALSLLLPLTFKIPSVSSIIMLSGIFYGAMYGGSTTSILVNIPGEAASVVTCLDGHQMARKGRAGPALGIAAIGSFVAGTISTAGLNLLSPYLVLVAIRFGPPEYFSVMLLGLVAALLMVGGSLLKAVLMIALGLFIGCVGMDPVKGVERFTFGWIDLAGGFDLIPVIVGMFGVSEILTNMEGEFTRSIFARKVKNILPNLDDLRKSSLPVLRGSILGFLVGLLPGGGTVMASFLSYSMERKLSRQPGKFGNGAIEGVAGPESANNSAVAAGMIPLLALGLPCNPVMALLMGALIIHGVQPGPMLMSQHPDVFWGVIASMYLGNFMLLILNLPLINVWVRLLRVPYWALFPLIFLLCVIGSYSANQNMFDVWVMIAFGVIGFLLRKRRYELGPFVLAVVLGPMIESSLRQSLIMSKGNPSIFISHPISFIFLIICFVVFAPLAWGELKRNKMMIRRQG